MSMTYFTPLLAEMGAFVGGLVGYAVLFDEPLNSDAGLLAAVYVSFIVFAGLIAPLPAIT